MSDAPSEQHRAAARARWGAVKLDRMAAEIASRSGEISPAARAALMAALEETMMTDPTSRRRFLEAYDAAADPDVADSSIGRLVRAERLSEVTLRDWESAADRLRHARIAAPDSDLSADRELNPDDRSALVELWRCEAAEQRAEAAYRRARATYDALAEEYERDSRELPTWRDDGLI